MRLFKDRRAAALELSRHLSFLKKENPIILGLVRSGVPMAEVIAHGGRVPIVAEKPFADETLPDKRSPKAVSLRTPITRTSVACGIA